MNKQREKIPSLWFTGDDPALAEIAWQNGLRVFRACPACHAALKTRPRAEYELFSSVKLSSLPQGITARDVLLRQLDELNQDYFDSVYLELNEATTREAFGADEQLCLLYHCLEQGRIRRLGLAFSGKTETFRSLLKRHREELSFCAFSLNYMDWTLLDAMGKYQAARDFGLPVLALEPSKGEILAKLPSELLCEIVGTGPGADLLKWCYAWLKAVGPTDSILLECADAASLHDHLKAAREAEPLTAAEEGMAIYLSGRLRHIEAAPPCTGCGHCDGLCPAQLDIPYLLRLYTALAFRKSRDLAEEYLLLPEKEKASACTVCCRCVLSCPKAIPVPAILKEIDTLTENYKINDGKEI